MRDSKLAEVASAGSELCIRFGRVLNAEHTVDDGHDAMRGDGLRRLGQIRHATGIVADDAQSLDDDGQQVDAGGRAADTAHGEDRPVP